ncbi:hypothetical protein [Granulicella arctica]|uniref:hypothetical protein n=1 Tax=Granulicella arctica TaxID=940613 RepID=UPI0021DF7C67|nr:hypothetical protein [Granulicella arctica]
MAVPLFVAQLVTTLFMTGLIWFVQIVHYPLFAEIGPYQLTRYENLHATRTSWVVFPPMLIELLTTFAALYPPLRPAFLTSHQAIALAALILIIWITTAIGHVPLHTKIGHSEAIRSRQSDVPLISLLVRLNWLRTLAWTTRTIILTTALLHTL